MVARAPEHREPGCLSRRPKGHSGVCARRTDKSSVSAVLTSLGEDGRQAKWMTGRIEENKEPVRRLL